ncbi:Pif1p [Rhizophagus irregularis DAOM 197198w]|uniref:ATP-dependent DNA helicase n=1 Tax=Rhizophagus irregularis (strain DAOM 197198w) TaxID=1432141 RepID=A0A015L5U8_RHIIW|nr:Pif1p [Rhizophagus irregularis DAOM 197198w]
MNLVDINTFLSRNPKIGEEKNVLMDYQTLNVNQKIVFERIESHYHNMFEGRQDEPLRIIVMGTAGTGKTYLIEAIRCRLREMAGESKSPIAVLALTGVAAFNTEGITIHSGLSILIVNNANCLDISGKRLKQLQDKLKDVSYVIIDEKSIVSRRILAIIDKRLRQAFPEHNNEPFGGSGIAAYKQFKEVYKLEIVQRQSGNSKEQQNFRNILLRLRNGESTIDDWKILTT